MDIRVAAYGVIIRDGLILLSHWNEHGRSGWTLPGGGVEGAEHPVQAAKRMMRMAWNEPFADHVHHVYLQLLPLMQSQDTKEGIAAFMEKRPPNFRGR